MSKELGHNYLFLREDIHPPVYQPNMSEDNHRRLTTAWYRGLDSEQRILHAMLTGQIFGFLGITSYKQVRNIIGDPELRQIASTRMRDQLGLAFGLKNPETIRDKLRDYGNDANALRDHLQQEVSLEGINLEMVNEVRASNDPTDLLFKALDGRWTAKARWDAKVKLQFMQLSGAIDRREREIGIDSQFERFVDWMRERVWNPKLLLGESSGVFLLSTHDPETWACTSTKWMEEKEGTQLQLQPFQKKDQLPSRKFQKKNKGDVEVYVTTREKPRILKIEKMLRKRAEDPAVAVDDDTGLLAVVKNIHDARSFVLHLIQQGYESGYPINIEDISYTLDGEEYKGNHGSSHKIRMMKFFIRLADQMRVECIIHTPETYAESLYMRGVAHPEYQVNRLFDSGIPDLIFNKEYFPYYDPETARRQRLIQIRRNIEESTIQS